MFRQKIIWSPVEVDYLKAHKDDPINQLTVALSKSRNAINKKLAELRGTSPATNKKSGPKNKKSNIGKRKDLGIFLRSGWEADCLRYLKTIKIVSLVEYEPTVFSFAPFGVLKGTVSYCPDFKMTFLDGTYVWIEVKGFLKRQDKTKINRFKKYFPAEFAKLRAITGSENTTATKFFKSIGVPIYAYYNDLKKEYKDKIPYWEG